MINEQVSKKIDGNIPSIITNQNEVLLNYTNSLYSSIDKLLFKKLSKITPSTSLTHK